ncbi:Ger(x)C family spore germination C-terminal domain-containing protein, partial [Corynebacterium diphtheriae]|uniref:Ger(x)C family spore germination C-terminal domain-containing protein n=1 Tax=Corynebacterium diphtheriae TaxID=1717 RepID=UPI001F4DCE2C
MDETESKGFNYITYNVSNTVSWVNCNDGGTISLEIMESNTNMQGSIDNGKPTINIDVTIKANVGDVECAIDLANPHEIQEVQKKAEQKTREIVNASVAAAQEFRSDIFGFGNAIKRAHPKEWEQLKDNWGTLFPDVKVHVQTRVEIKEAGMITKTLYE